MKVQTPVPFTLVPLIGMLFCQIEGERTREVWLVDNEAWNFWQEGGPARE